MLVSAWQSGYLAGFPQMNDSRFPLYFGDDELNGADQRLAGLLEIKIRSDVWRVFSGAMMAARSSVFWSS